jgi:exonuclease VII small subunit
MSWLEAFWPKKAKQPCTDLENTRTEIGKAIAEHKRAIAAKNEGSAALRVAAEALSSVVEGGKHRE